MKPHLAPINHHIKLIRLFRSRAIVCLSIMLIFALILITRLVILQIKDYQFYATLSRQNLLSIAPIPANRGLIYDRNGILLARNIPSYSLAIMPEVTKNLTTTIDQLKKIVPISNHEIKRFHRILKQYHPFQPVPLKNQLTPQQVAQFYVNRYRFPGVIIQTRLLRDYPLGKLTSDIVGYVSRINPRELAQLDHQHYQADDYIGKMGIEKYYEKQLHGVVGTDEAEINASGRTIRLLKRIPPQPGKNLYLTIDSRLQAIASKALGKETGAIVVIQPTTGQVLAMVSKPTYNPNLFVTGLSPQDVTRLFKSKQHPLYNLATRGQFAPGSTIKPFMAIVGLDKEIITPQYRIFDPGWFRLPGTHHIYHDWWRRGHGWVNVTKAIIVSCDVFFYKLAANMGISRIDQTLFSFGFGKKTQINLPNERTGLVPTPNWKMGATGHQWYTGDTVEAGFGQGFLLITPLQLASAAATIAEHGLRYQPTVLLKTIAANGKVTLHHSIELPSVVLNHAWVWDTVIHAMQGVIDNRHGTAEFYGRHKGYTVAGKTGTAQLFLHNYNEDRVRLDIPKRLRNNHLFIAFAPVDHPQIAIAVVVEHSAMADRMTSKIFNYYFKHIEHEHTRETH